MRFQVFGGIKGVWVSKYLPAPFYSFLIVLVAASCTPAYKIPAAKFASRVSVQTSPFDPCFFYNSCNLQKHITLNWDCNYYIRSLKSKKQPEDVIHQLVVTMNYIDDNWVFYNAASDDTTKELGVIVIRRDVNVLGSGSAFTETIGVQLPQGYLEMKKESGFALRLSAKNGDGSFAIQIPPSYVTGHLLALANPNIKVERTKD